MALLERGVGFVCRRRDDVQHVVHDHLGSTTGASKVAEDWGGSEAAPVPAWLCTPPLAAPSPPTVTRAPLLPTDDLTWPDFERLCVRLLAAEVGGDGLSSSWLKGTGVTRLYGTPGQAQEGIDLFARDPLPLGEPAPDRHVVTLQSRRVRVVTVVGFENAVADFQRGRWESRTRQFIYATSASAVRIQLADTIEAQAIALAQAGVDLVVWDREAMSDMLRSQPRLVDDFFGRAWVEAFCGAHAASQLGSRLDADEVAALRAALRGLYAAAFAVADSGQLLTPRAQGRPASLSERFVTPALEPIGTLDQLTGVGGSRRAARADEPKSDPTRDAPLGDRAVGYGSHPDLADRASAYRGGGSLSGDWYIPSSWMRSEEGEDARGQAVEAPQWLGSGEQQFVLGEPGTGKSTVLRFLVLDLLSDDPQWPAVARHWGDRLPVWLPFHYFTQRVRSGTGQAASVVEAIRAWFEQHDFGHLMPLVDRALSDDRLLLVVDGLDEWATPAAGDSAAAALETFVGARQASIIMSARPYALDRIALAGQWQAARLAPLTRAHQRQLALPFFTSVAAAGLTDAPGIGSDSSQPLLDAEQRAGLARRSVDAFLDEVHATADLRAMAAVPLFLVLLVGLRLATGGRLPERRFEVFDNAVKLLVTDHRSRRRVAASIAEPPPIALADRQLRAVLAQVAFAAQVRGDLRAISDNQLHQDLVAALMEPDVLALPQPEAIALANDIADLAEGDLGLLVRLGPAEVGFIHRSLHEHLAAEHLAYRLNSEQLHAIVAERVRDARWREVLLGALWVTSSPDRRRGIAEAVRGAVDDSETGIAAAELLAEMVCGPYEIPGETARTMATSLVERLGHHPLLSHRAALMRHFVSGVDNVVVSPIVAQRVIGWAVQVDPPSPSLLRQLPNTLDRPGGTGPSPRTSPPEPDQESAREDSLGDVLDILLIALRNLDPAVAWAAAATLLDLGKPGAPQHDLVRDHVRERLLQCLDDPTSSAGAAASLAVLCLWWPEEDATLERIEHHRRSQSRALRVTALAHRLGVLSAGLEGRLMDEQVFVDRLDRTEADWLRSLLGGDELRFADAHSGVVIAAVAAAIKDDNQVRDHLIEGMLVGTGPDLDAVWTFAPMVFGHDPEVAKVIADVIAGEEKPWPILRMGFESDSLTTAYAEGRPHRALIAQAIESRLAKYGHRHQDILLYALAQIDQGPQMRQALLDRLTEAGSFPHWSASALAQHFADDPEVNDSLRRALSGPAAEASRIAGVVPAILGPDAGRRRLLEMLHELAGEQDGAPRARFDMIASALVACVEALDDPELREPTCAEALPLLAGRDGLWHGDPQFDLALRMSDCPSARGVLDDRFRRDSAAERPRRSSPDRYLAGLLHASAKDPRHRKDLLNRACAQLTAQPPSIRAELNRLLASGAVRPEIVSVACSGWADDVAVSVKSVASLAYHRALLAQRGAGLLDDAEWTAAIAYAADVASSYGHDHEARRRAAWVGLCVLGAWDQVLERRETIGTAEPVAVTLSDVFNGPDAVLVGEIAKCWPQLRAMFGESLEGRLSGTRGESDDPAVWGALATGAAQSTQLEQELRAAVTKQPSLLKNESVLTWFVIDPSRDREAATRAVVDAVESQSHLREAGVLIAQDPISFDLDVALLTKLLVARLEEGADGNGFGNPTLECLAVLQPEHPKVQEVWQRLRTFMGPIATDSDDNQDAERQTRLPGHPDEVPDDDPNGEGDASPAVSEPRRRIHAQTAYAVAFTAAPSSEVPKLVVKALAAVTREERSLFAGAVVRHARRRLAKDPAAAEFLRRLAASQDTPLDLAVQVAVLMATVPRNDRSPDVVDACLRRLNDEQPTLVRDPVLGATVSAKVSLLNAARQRNG